MAPDNSHKGVEDEKKLVSRLKQGNEGAFRDLIRQYQPGLLGIAYGITLDREESLDIVQDVFLKVYTNIHSFRGDARLSTWLYRITINQCLNWKRRWRRKFKWHHAGFETEGADSFPEFAADDDYPETLYQQKECQTILWKTVNRLPEEARAVFVLKEWEGLSYEAIAKVLRIKKGTVSSRLFYARQRLKEALKKYLDEGES